MTIFKSFEEMFADGSTHQCQSCYKVISPGHLFFVEWLGSWKWICDSCLASAGRFR